MDLNFTFADNNSQTPTASLGMPGISTTPESRELFVEVRETGNEYAATAISGDGVTYATARRHARTGEQNADVFRGVLARIIAELDEPLNRHLTALRLTAEALTLMQELEGVDAHSRTTDALQTRTGVPAGTSVTILTD